MELNKLVFAGLSLGCLTAAAAGGYLAAGSRTPDETTAIQAPATVTPESEAGKAVTESEGVILPDSSSPTAPGAAAPSAEAPAPSTARVEATKDRAASPSRKGQTASQTQRAPRETSRVATPPASSRSARTDTASRDSASSPSSSASSNGGMWETRPAIEPERAPAIVEPEAPPEPSAPEMMDLVVPADSVLGLQIERTISSEAAKVEDRVEARVTRDVRVGDRVAIPAGSLVQGSVTEVERGGKIKERAKLAIRFHTVVLADGSRLNIKTDSVVREGSSPANESAAKIGGAAVGGAILGAILGGGKGAVIGGTVGAAGGTAATMAGGRNPAILPAGSTVSVRVQQPVTVTVEQ
jgi:hypothetical protein